MGNSGSSAGGGIAGLGVLLICVGVICYLYPEEQATYWGLSSTTVYPFRGIGELLLIFGIITTVIGGIVAALASSSTSNASPPSQVIHHYTQPSPQYVQQSSPSVKYCSSCGRSIPLDSLLCPYCGTRGG